MNSKSKFESKLNEIEKRFLSLSPFDKNAAKSTLPALQMKPKLDNRLKSLKVTDKTTVPKLPLIKEPKKSLASTYDHRQSKLPLLRTNIDRVRSNLTIKESTYQLKNNTTGSYRTSSNESLKPNYEYVYYDTNMIWDYIKSYDLEKEEFDSNRFVLDEVKLSLSKVDENFDYDEYEEVKPLPSHNIPYKTDRIVTLKMRLYSNSP